MKVNKSFWQYLNSEGNLKLLLGGRRSGKTYAILLYLITQCALTPKTIVSIATMTTELGYLGVFKDIQDICNILGLNYLCIKRPMLILFTNGSYIIIKSYSNSLSAKGIAIDYLYMNEANLFDYLLFIDLKVNVRLKTIIDYNPNIEFWGDELGVEPHISSWVTNPFLTEELKKYFLDLKERAMSSNATPRDIYFYKVYYEGKYCELSGGIFNEEMFKWLDTEPTDLKDYIVYIDASALRGSDYTALCLTARDDKNIYLIDSYSINVGSRNEIYNWLYNVSTKYDIRDIFIETTGLMGVDWQLWLLSVGILCSASNSKYDKYLRVLSNYFNFLELSILDTYLNRNYMLQVYLFDKKCKNDDNIDALNNAITYHKTLMAYTIGGKDKEGKHTNKKKNDKRLN